MHCRLWIKLFLVLFLLHTVNCESYYSINAPGSIVANRKYSVLVALHEASGPAEIRIAIEGPSFKEFKDVKLQPFEHQVIDFFPKKLESGYYFLKSEDLNDSKFKNASIIGVLPHAAASIYIQTDKVVYKPEDVVRFRFVVLDEHTRPLNVEDPIHVEILDSKNNRVKQFKNISLTQGIYTGKFQLSKYPVLGDWNITMTIDGTYNYSASKSIKIKNYILPKFSVYLKTPRDIILDTGLLKVGIYGKYTFGKYVEGNATIELWDIYESSILQTQNIDLQNSGFIDFNLKTVNDIETYSGLYVKGSLTEKNTGKTESEKKLIRLRKQRYNLVISEEDIEFENNKPFSIKVKVEHWTGAPVLDRKTPVTLEHGNNTYQSLIDSTGAAMFDFEYDGNAQYKFQYKDSETVFPSISTNNNLQLGNREYYCRLKLVDKRLQIGKPVLIEVSSIVNIPYLMYIVMGHGNIIRTEYIKVPPQQKSYTISITPTIEMIPTSYIYVYYIHKGHLRYEEMSLQFLEEFENQILISAPREAKPGEDVTIMLNAQLESYIGILGVDLGVYILDSDYDLNRHQIISDLRGKTSFAPYPLPDYPGIISGLITFTNAHYPFEDDRRITGYSAEVEEDYEEHDEPHMQVTTQSINEEEEEEIEEKAKKEEEVISISTMQFHRFRQTFPETWIFDNYLIEDNQTKLTLQIPDTITTWRLTAFSTNAVTGFGIVNKASNILSTQKFFISLFLPYFVKRGEIVVIPVTVFNYSNQTLNTEVILHNIEKHFYLMESTRQKVEKSSDEQQQIKKISIAEGKGKMVKFVIVPIKAGVISLHVTATSPSYSDAVWEKLKVEPEGVPKDENQALFLSIPEGDTLSSSFKIDDPVDSVPDSEYITFSVGGHYLVPTVENFQNLTEMPTGSGEQNMINFAPSVLILQYLKLNGKLSKEKQLVESLQSSIEVSYQEQLSYRHDKGGYSIFGMGEDEEPSTWLTAYVVRYFIKALPFLDIERQIIENDLEYLSSQQNPNGAFPNTEDLLETNHADEYELTAFILLAFLEDEIYASQYRTTIENGAEFLNSNLNNVQDVKGLSLIATVLKRVRLHDANILIDKIKSHGQEDNGLTWWSRNDLNPANDIEVTANAALTLLETPGDYTSILKWLIKQRNANGGFISCYDTVAGMEALVKFSEKYTNINDVNLTVTYNAMDGEGNEVATNELQVDSNNVLNMQRHELPRATRQVHFKMLGTGVSLVQLNQQYNVDNVREFRHFNIDSQSIFLNEDECNLKICFTYISDTSAVNETTNMVIIEVNLPSGFRSEAENSSDLKQNALVLKIETKNSESTVILYLKKLIANEKNCLEIPMFRAHDVLKPKAAAILIYDYSNLTRSNTQFYNL